MAKKDEKEAQADEAPPKSKMIIIIAIVAVVALLVGGGVVAFLLMSGQDKPAESTESTIKPAIYHELKPPFVVNFQAQGRQRYLQVGITIMTRDGAVISALEKHMPLVRNNLIDVFGSQNFDGLRTPEGKEGVRMQAFESLQQIVLDETGNAGIEQVLFTNFVMQ